MVLKIERNVSGPRNVLMLSGRIGSDDVQTLKACMDDGERVTAIDLGQVHLANLDAVRFLAECDQRGVELLNGRPHVRVWIYAEKQRLGVND